MTHSKIQIVIWLIGQKGTKYFIHFGKVSNKERIYKDNLYLFQTPFLLLPLQRTKRIRTFSWISILTPLLSYKDVWFFKHQMLHIMDINPHFEDRFHFSGTKMFKICFAWKRFNEVKVNRLRHLRSYNHKIVWWTTNNCENFFGLYFRFSNWDPSFFKPKSWYTFSVLETFPKIF